MSVFKISYILCAALLAASFSAGCGGDGGGATADAAAIVLDAAFNPDAGPYADAAPLADAAPVADATPVALSCLGQPLPSVAPDPVTVAGSTFTVGLSGQTAIAGASISAYTVGTTSNPLAMATSAANGAYSMSAATGGLPLNAYVRAEAATYLDTYLFPPWPISSDFDGASVIMLSNGALALAANLTGATQTANNGFIALIVADCNGDPVAGAEVEATGTHGVIRYMSGGLPSGSATVTDADGIAFVFDVVPGSVSVAATYMGLSFREHSVNVIANTLTATMVAP